VDIGGDASKESQTHEISFTLIFKNYINTSLFYLLDIRYIGRVETWGMFEMVRRSVSLGRAMDTVTTALRSGSSKQGNAFLAKLGLK